MDTLESLYFFTQSLAGDPQERIKTMRSQFPRLPRSTRVQLLREIGREIREIRDHYGAIATNKRFRDLLSEAREAQAPPHLPKLYIDRHLFRRYARVFLRWDHVKSHAFAVFDHVDNKPIDWLFELEGTHLRDARYFLNCATDLHIAIHDKGDQSADARRHYHAYLHGCTAATFSFVEAYLNGIAFDCFHAYHDSLNIENHDLLAEWDSAKKLKKRVPLEKKIFKYPVIVAKMLGKNIDMSGWKEAHYLASQGKDTRDALTHPSAHLNPQTGEQDKVAHIAHIRVTTVKPLFDAALGYAKRVEGAISNNPKLSAPWLYE